MPRTGIGRYLEFLGKGKVGLTEKQWLPPEMEKNHFKEVEFQRDFHKEKHTKKGANKVVYSIPVSKFKAYCYKMGWVYWDSIDDDDKINHFLQCHPEYVIGT